MDVEYLNLHPNQDMTECKQVMRSLKLKINHGPYVLRWGHTPKGTFCIKESYHLKFNAHLLNKDVIWETIWHIGYWVKICTFLYLVCHGCILTWDNQLKTGFLGPFFCSMFSQEEESINHLLDTYPFSSSIWDEQAMVMRKYDRKRGNVVGTFTSWPSSNYHNPIVNKVWKMLLGLVVSGIWKEKNHRIFKRTSDSWQVVWHKLWKNIRESLIIMHQSD